MSVLVENEEAFWSLGDSFFEKAFIIGAVGSDYLAKAVRDSFFPLASIVEFISFDVEESIYFE